MFYVQIKRPDSDNLRRLPRSFATIADARSFQPHSGQVVRVEYPDGKLAARVS